MDERTVTVSFSSRLYQLMNERCLSQQMIANYASVAQPTVSRWLTGSIPEIENVSLLAKRVGVPLAWLAYGEGSIDPPVMTVAEYLARARERVLPRIQTIIQHLDKMLEERWLHESDADLIESLRLKFTERKRHLIEVSRTFEQLPHDDVPLIEEKLFGKRTVKDDNPLLDFRMKICHVLGIEDRNASDEEILKQCRDALDRSPSSASMAARKRSLDAQKALFLRKAAARSDKQNGAPSGAERLKQVQAAKAKLTALAEARKRTKK